MSKDLEQLFADNPIIPAVGNLAHTSDGVSGASEVENIADVNKHKYRGQNLQTGTSYELVLTDAGKIVDLENAAPISLVIPANAAVAFDVDTRIDLMPSDAGQITVSITSDTLRGDPKSQAQWKGLSLWKRATTEWVVLGGTT